MATDPEAEVERATPGLAVRRRAAVAALVGLVALMVTTVSVRGIEIPDVRGDQLLFFFDVRPYEDATEGESGRTSFVSVLNPADKPIFVELATYPMDLAQVPQVRVARLRPGESRIFEIPASVADAGVLVVTPVRSREERTPVVPPVKLAGSFAVGSPYGSFGDNALARSVEGERIAGAPVDGAAVRYEPIRPTSGILAIPSHFNPATLNGPEQDGARVVLVAFADSYGDEGFRLAAPEAPLEVMPTFCGPSGARPGRAIEVSGVAVEDLRDLAGDEGLAAGGSVSFVAAQAGASFFGLFSQGLAHIGVGQRMVALAQLPPCFPRPTPAALPPPGITPIAVCGNGVLEGDEECEGSDVGSANCLADVGGTACTGAVRCLADRCKLDLSGCTCQCEADRRCTVDIDCDVPRPGCGIVGGCIDGTCLTTPPTDQALIDFCNGINPENGKPRCPTR